MRAIAGITLLASLVGCASVTSDQAVSGLSTWSERADVPVATLVTSDVQRDTRRARVDQLLASPLGEAQAVELALIHSPALQALLADSWAQQARAAQAGSLPAPVLSLERMAGEDMVSITRMLAVGLTELVTWPMRQDASTKAQRALRLQLAADVLKATQAVRQQWVRAVAAGQLLRYQTQVQDTALAGAELARRMQAVGNFSRTQRAREQLFLTETAAQLARAEMAAAVEREALARLLGLNGPRMARLVLPTQLAELPAAARKADDVARAALAERLDLRLAEAQWQAAARSEGPAFAAAFDVEGAAIRESVTGGERERGFELALRLPTDAAVRLQAASATTLAARNRLEQAHVDAGSMLRERFAGYRTAYDLARHQRDQVLVLRKTIADEAVLRYNGMLIGVFELLGEARAQAAAVVATIESLRDFWLSDAALNAALLGVPSMTPSLSAPDSTAADASKGH